MYDEDIKRLAPRGYRMVHIEQNFREDDRLLDVNRQNMLNNQEGTFMGRSVSNEQEYIAPPSTVRIAGVSTDPETGFTKLILETLAQRRNAGGAIFESGPSNKIVPGVGNTDTVPAMLTPGEFVINKKATSANMQLLRAINNGTLRGYQVAGQVIGFDENGNEIKNPRTARRRITQNLPVYANIGDAHPMDAGQVNDAIKRRGTPTQERTPARTPSTGRGMAFSMGMGTIGSAMMMAPMIPGIGENAGLSNALSIGGTALSAASIIPVSYTHLTLPTNREV